MKDIKTQQGCENTAEVKVVKKCGHVWTEEEKQRARERRLGQKWSPEVRAKMSQSALGKPKSDEARAKMSQAKKGRTLTEEHKRKISESSKTREWKISPEGLEKIRRAQTGKTMSPELKEKLFRANKGRHPSDEARKRMSQSRLGSKHSEETKKKMSKASMGRLHNDETRKRLSISHGGKGEILSCEERLLIRRTTEYSHWKKAVLKRDSYSCQICGKKKYGEDGKVVERLHCHHIQGWWDREDLRFDASNGVAYCKKCHMTYHSLLAKLRKKILREGYEVDPLELHELVELQLQSSLSSPFDSM